MKFRFFLTKLLSKITEICYADQQAATFNINVYEHQILKMKQTIKHH